MLIFSRALLCIVLFFFGHQFAVADDAPIHVVYINGIQSLHDDVIHIDVKKVRDILTDSVNHSPKRPFIVEAVYNPIGWFGIKTGSSFEEDVMELFLLKTAEEKYAPFFPSIAVPHNDPKPIFVPAAKAVKTFLDNMLPGGTILEDKEWIAAADMNATQKAARDLAAKIGDLKRAIVVAHSQGNLLAHLAYASVASEHGDDTTRMMRVLNVANNARFSVNGLDFTRTEDRALLGLEILPSVLEWWRNTPSCTAPKLCNFSLADPTMIDASGAGDPAGHEFVKTYLSDFTVSLSETGRTNGVAFTPGATRFRDRFEDFVYAAAASLDAANPIPPNAEGITFIARGRVTQIFSRDNLPITDVLPQPVAIGDPVVFTIKFNSATPDKFSTIGNIGLYSYSSVSMTIGDNKPIVRTTGNIQVGLWPTGWNYGVSTDSTGCSACVEILPSLQLVGAPASAFPSDALPLSPPPISAFGSGFLDRVMTLGFFDASGTGLSGSGPKQNHSLVAALIRRKK